MQQQFLKIIFPTHRINSSKRQMTTFTQKLRETFFYKFWDRYRDLLNTCPHHGFETWRLVSYFYEGLTPRDRQMVQLICNPKIGYPRGGELSFKNFLQTLSTN